MHVHLTPESDGRSAAKVTLKCQAFPLTRSSSHLTPPPSPKLPIVGRQTCKPTRHRHTLGRYTSSPNISKAIPSGRSRRTSPSNRILFLPRRGTGSSLLCLLSLRSYCKHVHALSHPPPFPSKRIAYLPQMQRPVTRVRQILRNLLVRSVKTLYWPAECRRGYTT
jgi:hypothetical protein